MKRKKIATILLSLTMMASVMAVPQSVHAADSVSVGDGVTATLSDDGNTVTFSGTGAITKSLTEAGIDTDSQKNITAVVIEDGITSIDTDIISFGYSGTGTATLTLPSTLETIGQSAFQDDKFTGNLVIPEGVTSIGANAFYGTTFDGTLTLPSTLETIGQSAFQDSYLTGNLAIPEGVTSIGANAFYKTRFNGTLTLPSTLETISNGAFMDTDFTGDLIIPEGVTSIEEAAFYGCENLTGKIVIPDSVQTIGDNAFRGAQGITRIEIGDGVTSIGVGAFNLDSEVETEIASNNDVVNDYSWDGTNRIVSFMSLNSGNNIQVQDGAGTGTTTMNGRVSTITSIDVTVPIGGINFVIEEDGQLQAQGIVIESNTAVPLSVNMVSVTPLEAGDETEGLAATSHKAPALVLANKYTADEWNNLTKDQTEAEIAISLKQVDVTPEGEAGTELTDATTDELKVSTPVELGDLSSKKALAHVESGYGEAAKCAINIETAPEYTNYGKAWISADDITFRYLTTLEFAFDM